MSDEKLSEVIAKYRTDRPDEWSMDIFIRGAEKLEAEYHALSYQLFLLYQSLDVRDIELEDANKKIKKLEGEG